MFYFALITLLIVQTCSAHRRDSYFESSDGYLSYPEEMFDDNDFEVERRNNQFLRFGRRDEKFKHNFDDYEDFARPTRAGKREKNDHFIRFGRGNSQDFLRFGRDQDRVTRRVKENYLRFGRNMPDEDTKQRRKRETSPEDNSHKRGDSFLRFGRNSNFMRFGRDPSMQLLKQLQNSEVLRLLAELETQQERLKPCGGVA